MPTLLEKIESHASLRLTLPRGVEPAQELARYKDFIKIETHRLRILHRGGEDGKTVCAGRAAMMDALIRSISAAVLAMTAAGLTLAIKEEPARIRSGPAAGVPVPARS
jgi:[protein-PII] uridylyltransferase